MTPRILAIGTATPPGRLSQGRAIDLMRSFLPGDVPNGLIAALHRRSGIETRSVVIIDPESGEQTLYKKGDGERGPTTAQRLKRYTTAASTLACDASAMALATAGIGPDRITHVVSVSCTGFEAPGVDQMLVRGLGLRPSVGRTHIGFMGCHAALNGLGAARAVARADPDAVVLLCCVELCTLHMHYTTRPDQLIANALFADGAGAAVVAQSCETTLPELRACASWLFSADGDAMSWRIGDHGFEMTLRPEVPDLLGEKVPSWIDAVLDSCGARRSDVGGWAIHPGGPKVVESIARGLGLSKAATVDSLGVLRDHGNMSSPTVLFILDRFMRTAPQTPRPWVAMAFGPGLAAEAVVLW